MLYEGGADASLDRPAHVRAGSACALLADGTLDVAQDDASFLALVDPTTGRARAVPLPAGPGGARTFDEARGNKQHKMDLEACFAIGEPSGGERVVVLGSGSTAARHRVVSFAPASREPPRVVELTAFYETLGALTSFAGSELNVEGAAVVGDRLRLFNRGNGAPRGGLAPVNATCDVPLAAFLAHLDDPARVPLPPIDEASVVAFDLGEGLTFTDATSAGGDAVVYLAAAEDSPDATCDGPVSAVAIGVVTSDDVRYARLADDRGANVLDKAEGVALRGGVAYVVVDRDAPDIASDLCVVELRGAWP